MWVVVSGPMATSKQKIIEYLETDGFEELKLRDTKTYPISFHTETAFCMSYLESFMKARDNSEKKLVSSRCIWDAVEVFGRVALKRSEISEGEFKALEAILGMTVGHDTVPSAVIYMKPDMKMTSFNRMLMKGEKVDEEYFNDVCIAYDEYMEKIAVPVIEIPHTDIIDHILDNVKFGMAGIKSSGSAENSIWKRE